MARSRRGHCSLLALPLAVACAGTVADPAAMAVGPTSAADGSSGTVWAGVYSAAQADRGADAYLEACSSCHSADLRGDSNAPGLVGVGFLFLWEDRSLQELFTAIRTEMPPNAPGSLPVESYLDLLAHILRANEFPDGPGDLAADPAVLATIVITGRPGA